MYSRARVLSLVALAGCASGQSAARPDARARDAIARLEARVLPAVLVAGETRGVPLAQRLRAERIPAISIAVFNDYRLDWAKAYGTADDAAHPATIDTLFQAGSISKPVSALAALLAVARGKLS